MSDGTTHYAGCIEAGSKHYKCALAEIGRLRDTITDLRKRLQTETQLLLDGNKIASKAHREEVADLRNQLEKKAWFSAYEKKEWVGLTGEEMKQCSYDTDGFTIDREVAMRAVESKLKEKNT